MYIGDIHVHCVNKVDQWSMNRTIADKNLDSSSLGEFYELEGHILI